MYLLTFKEEKLKIIKHYSIKINGSDTYKILDENNIEYVISEDILISNRRCKDIWNIIIENQTYIIKYYGFNLPLFSIYYKIIDLKECNK